jgi:hypothetical protein
MTCCWALIYIGSYQINELEQTFKGQSIPVTWDWSVYTEMEHAFITLVWSFILFVPSVCMNGGLNGWYAHERGEWFGDVQFSSNKCSNVRFHHLGKNRPKCSPTLFRAKLIHDFNSEKKFVQKNAQSNQSGQQAKIRYAKFGHGKNVFSALLKR